MGPSSFGICVVFLEIKVIRDKIRKKTILKKHKAII